MTSSHPTFNQYIRQRYSTIPRPTTAHVNVSVGETSRPQPTIQVADVSHGTFNQMKKSDSIPEQIHHVNDTIFPTRFQRSDTAIILPRQNVSTNDTDDVKLDINVESSFEDGITSDEGDVREEGPSNDTSLVSNETESELLVNETGPLMVLMPRQYMSVASSTRDSTSRSTIAAEWSSMLLAVQESINKSMKVLSSSLYWPIETTVAKVQSKSSHISRRVGSVVPSGMIVLPLIKPTLVFQNKLDSSPKQYGGMPKISATPSLITSTVISTTSRPIKDFQQSNSSLHPKRTTLPDVSPTKMTLIPVISSTVKSIAKPDEPLTPTFAPSAVSTLNLPEPLTPSYVPSAVSTPNQDETSTQSHVPSAVSTPNPHEPLTPSYVPSAVSTPSLQPRPDIAPLKTDERLLVDPTGDTKLQRTPIMESLKPSMQSIHITNVPSVISHVVLLPSKSVAPSQIDTQSGKQNLNKKDQIIIPQKTSAMGLGVYATATERKLLNGGLSATTAEQGFPLKSFTLIPSIPSKPHTSMTDSTQVDTTPIHTIPRSIISNVMPTTLLPSKSVITIPHLAPVQTKSLAESSTSYQSPAFVSSVKLLGITPSKALIAAVTASLKGIVKASDHILDLSELGAPGEAIGVMVSKVEELVVNTTTAAKSFANVTSLLGKLENLVDNQMSQKPADLEEKRIKEIVTTQNNVTDQKYEGVIDRLNYLTKLIETLESSRKDKERGALRTETSTNKSRAVVALNRIVSKLKDRNFRQDVMSKMSDRHVKATQTLAKVKQSPVSIGAKATPAISISPSTVDYRTSLHTHEKPGFLPAQTPSEQHFMKVLAQTFSYSLSLNANPTKKTDMNFGDIATQIELTSSGSASSNFKTTVTMSTSIETQQSDSLRQGPTRPVLTASIPATTNAQTRTMKSTSKIEKFNRIAKKCNAGLSIHPGYSLRAGFGAGLFSHHSEIKTLAKCIRKCCSTDSCTLVLMLQGSCFNVRCKSKWLCGKVKNQNKHVKTTLVFINRGDIEVASFPEAVHDDIEASGKRGSIVGTTKAATITRTTQAGNVSINHELYKKNFIPTKPDISAKLDSNEKGQNKKSVGEKHSENVTKEKATTPKPTLRNHIQDTYSSETSMDAVFRPVSKPLASKAKKESIPDDNNNSNTKNDKSAMTGTSDAVVHSEKLTSSEPVFHNSDSKPEVSTGAVYHPESFGSDLNFGLMVRKLAQNGLPRSHNGSLHLSAASNLDCKHGNVHYDTVLAGGWKAGEFQRHHDVSHMLECVQRCCDEPACHVAMLMVHCYTVHCFDVTSCEPKTPNISFFRPKIVFVRTPSKLSSANTSKSSTYKLITLSTPTKEVWKSYKSQSVSHSLSSLSQTTSPTPTLSILQLPSITTSLNTEHGRSRSRFLIVPSATVQAPAFSHLPPSRAIIASGGSPKQTEAQIINSLGPQTVNLLPTASSVKAYSLGDKVSSIPAPIVKPVFNREGVIYNNIQEMRPTEPRKLHFASDTIKVTTHVTYVNRQETVLPTRSSLSKLDAIKVTQHIASKSSELTVDEKSTTRVPSSVSMKTSANLMRPVATNVPAIGLSLSMQRTPTLPSFGDLGDDFISPKVHNGANIGKSKGQASELKQEDINSRVPKDAKRKFEVTDRAEIIASAFSINKQSDFRMINQMKKASTMMQNLSLPSLKVSNLANTKTISLQSSPFAPNSQQNLKHQGAAMLKEQQLAIAAAFFKPKHGKIDINDKLGLQAKPEKQKNTVSTNLSFSPSPSAQSTGRMSSSSSISQTDKPATHVPTPKQNTSNSGMTTLMESAAYIPTEKQKKLIGEFYAKHNYNNIFGHLKELAGNATLLAKAPHVHASLQRDGSNESTAKTDSDFLKIFQQVKHVMPSKFCSNSHVIKGSILTLGWKAGEFSDGGPALNITECLTKCCDTGTCNVALFVKHRCFLVNCKYPESCAQTSTDGLDVQPSLAYVPRNQNEVSVFGSFARAALQERKENELSEMDKKQRNSLLLTEALKSQQTPPSLSQIPPIQAAKVYIHAKTSVKEHDTSKRDTSSQKSVLPSSDVLAASPSVVKMPIITTSRLQPSLLYNTNFVGENMARMTPILRVNSIPQMPITSVRSTPDSSFHTASVWPLQVINPTRSSKFSSLLVMQTMENMDKPNAEAAKFEKLIKLVENLHSDVRSFRPTEAIKQSNDVMKLVLSALRDLKSNQRSLLQNLSNTAKRSEIYRRVLNNTDTERYQSLGNSSQMNLEILNVLHEISNKLQTKDLHTQNNARKASIRVETPVSTLSHQASAQLTQTSIAAARLFPTVKGAKQDLNLTEDSDRRNNIPTPRQLERVRPAPRIEADLRNLVKDKEETSKMMTSETESATSLRAISTSAAKTAALAPRSISIYATTSYALKNGSVRQKEVHDSPTEKMTSLLGHIDRLLNYTNAIERKLLIAGQHENKTNTDLRQIIDREISKLNMTKTLNDLGNKLQNMKDLRPHKDQEDLMKPLVDLLKSAIQNVSRPNAARLESQPRHSAPLFVSDAFEEGERDASDDKILLDILDEIQSSYYEEIKKTSVISTAKDIMQPTPAFIEVKRTLETATTFPIRNILQPTSAFNGNQFLPFSSAITQPLSIAPSQRIASQLHSVKSSIVASTVAHHGLELPTVFKFKRQSIVPQPRTSEKVPQFSSRVVSNPSAPSLLNRNVVTLPSSPVSLKAALESTHPTLTPINAVDMQSSVATKYTATHTVLLTHATTPLPQITPFSSLQPAPSVTNDFLDHIRVAPQRILPVDDEIDFQAELDYLTPQPECKHTEILTNQTLKHGFTAGTFRQVGMVRSMTSCISNCCKDVMCDAAFMLGDHCVIVYCKTTGSCDTVTAKKSNLTPKISFIIRKRLEGSKTATDKQKGMVLESSSLRIDASTKMQFFSSESTQHVLPATTPILYTKQKQQDNTITDVPVSNEKESVYTFNQLTETPALETVKKSFTGTKLVKDVKNQTSFRFRSNQNGQGIDSILITQSRDIVIDGASSTIKEVPHDMDGSLGPENWLHNTDRSTSNISAGQTGEIPQSLPGEMPLEGSPRNLPLCSYSPISYNVTLRHGLESGYHKDQGSVTVEECSHLCCQSPGCDVAFMLSGNCYSVNCPNKNMCELIGSSPTKPKTSVVFIQRTQPMTPQSVYKHIHQNQIQHASSRVFPGTILPSISQNSQSLKSHNVFMEVYSSQERGSVANDYEFQETAIANESLIRDETKTTPKVEDIGDEVLPPTVQGGIETKYVPTTVPGQSTTQETTKATGTNSMSVLQEKKEENSSELITEHPAFNEETYDRARGSSEFGNIEMHVMKGNASEGNASDAQENVTNYASSAHHVPTFFGNLKENGENVNNFEAEFDAIADAADSADAVADNAGIMPDKTEPDNKDDISLEVLQVPTNLPSRSGFESAVKDTEQGILGFSDSMPALPEETTQKMQLDSGRDAKVALRDSMLDTESRTELKGNNEGLETTRKMFDERPIEVKPELDLMKQESDLMKPEADSTKPGADLESPVKIKDSDSKRNGFEGSEKDREKPDGITLSNESEPTHDGRRNHMGEGRTGNAEAEEIQEETRNHEEGDTWISKPTTKSAVLSKDDYENNRKDFENVLENDEGRKNGKDEQGYGRSAIQKVAETSREIEEKGASFVSHRGEGSTFIVSEEIKEKHSCEPRQVKYDVIFSHGSKDKQFHELGRVNGMLTCTELCCITDRRCDAVLLLDDLCYAVVCDNEKACETVGSNSLDYKTSIAYMEKHRLAVSRRRPTNKVILHTRGSKKRRKENKVQSSNCMRHIFVTGIMKSGLNAGEITRHGIVKNEKECLKLCCEDTKCNVAFLLKKHCYSVTCHDAFDCMIDHMKESWYSPRIALVRGIVEGKTRHGKQKISKKTDIPEPDVLSHFLESEISGKLHMNREAGIGIDDAPSQSAVSALYHQHRRPLLNIENKETDIEETTEHENYKPELDASHDFDSKSYVRHSQPNIDRKTHDNLSDSHDGDSDSVIDRIISNNADADDEKADDANDDLMRVDMKKSKIPEENRRRIAHKHKTMEDSPFASDFGSLGAASAVQRIKSALELADNSELSSDSDKTDVSDQESRVDDMGSEHGYPERRKHQMKLLDEEKLKEQKQVEEEKKLREQEKLDEEAKLKEERRLQEEQQLKEDQRLKEEQRFKEERRLAEEQRLKAEQRRNEEQRLREYQSKLEKLLGVKIEKQKLEERRLKIQKEEQQRSKEESHNGYKGYREHDELRHISHGVGHGSLDQEEMMSNRKLGTFLHRKNNGKHGQRSHHLEEDDSEDGDENEDISLDSSLPEKRKSFVNDLGDEREEDMDEDDGYDNGFVVHDDVDDYDDDEGDRYDSIRRSHRGHHQKMLKKHTHLHGDDDSENEIERPSLRVKHLRRGHKHHSDEVFDDEADDNDDYDFIMPHKSRFESEIKRNKHLNNGPLVVIHTTDHVLSDTNFNMKKLKHRKPVVVMPKDDYDELNFYREISRLTGESTKDDDDNSIGGDTSQVIVTKNYAEPYELVDPNRQKSDLGMVLRRPKLVVSEAVHDDVMPQKDNVLFIDKPKKTRVVSALHEDDSEDYPFVIIKRKSKHQRTVLPWQLRHELDSDIFSDAILTAAGKEDTSKSKVGVLGDENPNKTSQESNVALKMTPTRKLTPKKPSAAKKKTTSVKPKPTRKPTTMRAMRKPSYAATQQKPIILSINVETFPGSASPKQKIDQNMEIRKLTTARPLLELNLGVTRKQPTKGPNILKLKPTRSPKPTKRLQKPTTTSKHLGELSTSSKHKKTPTKQQTHHDVTTKKPTHKATMANKQKTFHLGPKHGMLMHFSKI